MRETNKIAVVGADYLGGGIAQSLAMSSASGSTRLPPSRRP